MRKAIPTLLASLLAALLLAPAAAAQVTSSTSSVTGVVTDQAGAVVSGATVTLTDTKTSKELTATTDDQGVYRFLQVQPGQGYKLSFTAAGFQTYTINDVALGVGNVETHNAQLGAGAVTETVEVTAANEATLNTTDATIGNNIDTRRLVDLPVQFRGSPAALLGLQPGVVGANVGTGAVNRVGSVTGSRADQGNIVVDGIDANDQATGQAFATTGNAPIDAVQEFRTITTNPLASEGRSSGGQIQMVTKSGTNEFHGSLREFNRTAATAANSFFNNRNGVERPQLTRNQFGGSLGGPIVRDRAFFFFDYEGRRDAQGITYTRIVPLQHVREGRLAYVNNAGGISFLTPAQIAALDPQGVGVNPAFLSLINERYPLPNDLTTGDGINTGGFRFNAPSHRGDNNYTARVDGNLTDRQTIFGRFSKIDASQTDIVNADAQHFPGDPETSQIVTGDYAFVVGHNWVLNEAAINQIRVGLTKSVLGFPTSFNPTSPQSYAFGLVTDPFPGFAEQFRDVPVWTLRDDLSWTRGSHSLQFGASAKFINQQTNLISDFNYTTVGLGGNIPNGFGTGAIGTALRPSNILNNTTARSLYDNAFAVLLGVIPTITTRFNYDREGNVLDLTAGSQRDWRYNEYEFYAQDSWRVRSDLTLNLGVRWHVYPAPYETNGIQSIQDLDFDTIFNRRLENSAAGISGADAVPLAVYTLGGKANDARPFYDTDWNNFGPRLSFAWNPTFTDGALGALFGERKTVVRGGFTILFDRPGGGITFLQDQNNNLFDAVVTTNIPGANARAVLLNSPRFTSVNTVPFTNEAPVITRPFTPNVEDGFPIGTATQDTNYAVDPNFRVPYSYQYSVGFQRELPGNFILDMSYVGRQSRQLFTLADASQIIDFRDPASGQFMLASFNALQAQVHAGGPITPQPWIENQVLLAARNTFGPGLVSCSQFVGAGPNCTTLVANFFTHLVETGGSADLVAGLFANGLLEPNVGLGAQFGTNAFVTNKGSSSYNGMLVSLRRRFAQGFQFDVNYTWSHSIDNQSTVANTTTSGGLICDATNLRVCRANSDFDIRHLFNVNGIWELPIGRGRAVGGDMPGWADHIVGGWFVSGIFSARSGLPFSLASVAWPRTFIFDGANGVPAVIEGDARLLRPSIHEDADGRIQFFADAEAARAAVRFPRHGEVGNRNALRGPSFWNLDTVVGKNFRLPWEGHRIQLRWESYNALNHHSFGLPADTDIGSNTFGQVTGSASTARVMQFGIRYDF
jgi:hypothetical protein